MAQAMSISVDGADHLLFRQMTWSESLGGVPRAAVGLVSLEKAVDPRKILGKLAKIRLQLPHDRERFFNGIVARFSRGGAVGRYYEYHAEVRPWLWLLSRTADCRIFQKMKVDEVLRKVFEGHAFADFALDLTGSHPVMDYCVQYRETDLDFVNRLCERFGLYYWFEYSSDGHQKLRIVDSLSAHEDAPGYESLPFHPATENPIDSEHIASWHSVDPLLPGKFVAQDFNYETSSLDLKAEKKIDHQHEHAGMEVFDYPGPFIDGDGGSAEAALRCEISACDFATFDVTTNAQGMLTGHTFKLTQHPDSEVNNKKFQITGISVSMHWAGHEAHGGDAGASFHCGFTAIPANVQFRTARRTRHPLVHGPQTATVVGPDGEEIYTDKLGRIKVVFHWDRYGKAKKAKDGGSIAPEDRSCWLRVAQLWAGNRYGTVFIPRIGHEVVVDFIDGDPDRPLVTGCVYNDKNPPPWLPDAPTQSGVLTRSSKGGTAANANAIRFDDKKGSEQLWIHAEKNQDNEVENDATHTVGHDRKKTIGHDETTQVKNNRTETVGNNETITIGGNRTESVGKNEMVSIGASQSITVGGPRTLTVAKASAETIALAKALTIGLGYQVSVGAAMNETVAGAKATEVGAYRTEAVALYKNTSVGKSYKLDIGGTSILTMADDGKIDLVGKEIKLHTGGGSLLIKDDGKIEISGTEITIKTGGGSIKIDSGGKIEAAGTDTTMKAGAGKVHVDPGGIIEIKGPMVKINT